MWRVVAEGPARSNDAKRRLRLRLLEARSNRSESERRDAATALCDRVLALPERRAGGSLCCYVSMAEEPGTGPLLDRLATLGHPVLLPVLRPDLDLGWALHQPGSLRSARFGTREPTGAVLGPDAAAAADLMVCPGLAADLSGSRLGRGGGSYDRVLARLPPGVLRVVLLYDDEVLSDVPTDGHDQPVHAIVTPTRTLRVSRTGGGPGREATG